MAKKPKPWTAEGQRAKERKPYVDGDSYLDGVEPHHESKLKAYQEQMLRAMEDRTFMSALLDDLAAPKYGGRQQGKTAMQQGKEEHERMIVERGSPRMEQVMLADPLGDGPEHLQYAVVEVRKGDRYYEAYDDGPSMVEFYEGNDWRGAKVQRLTWHRIQKTVFGHAIFELGDVDD